MRNYLRLERAYIVSLSLGYLRGDNGGSKQKNLKADWCHHCHAVGGDSFNLRRDGKRVVEVCTKFAVSFEVAARLRLSVTMQALGASQVFPSSHVNKASADCNRH